MKYPGIALIILYFSLSSCKKLVEEQQRDVLLEIMTQGQWSVESFIEGADSTTAQFTGYKFQFLSEGLVYGIHDGDSIPGVWHGDLENYSIQSEFPGAGDPLKKLNGTWKIKDSGIDFVAAEMTDQQGTMILHLRKNL